MKIENKRRTKHDHRQLGLAVAKGGTPPDLRENRLHNRKFSIDTVFKWPSVGNIGYYMI